MKGHPGGEEHTLHMLELSGLKPGARILDMGAGSGDTVRLLNALGCCASGIDLGPRGDSVELGDMLHAPYPDESFDAVVSQCTFYSSGHVDAALREARRLLRPGGTLLLSDVWFTDSKQALEAAGFGLLHREDMTPQWREYYIEAIWRGEADCLPVKGRCTYEMLIGKKE